MISWSSGHACAGERLLPEPAQLRPVGVAHGDAAEREEPALVDLPALVDEEEVHGHVIGDPGAATLSGMSELPLGRIADLGRYPIDRLDDAEGTALVERAREALHAVGACDLPGFLLPEAVDAAVASALSVRGKAYRTEQTHDIEFSGLAADSLSADDPRRTRIRSGKEGTALDDIPADSPVRALYESDEMLAFIGAALEIDPIFRSEDPLGALNYMYYAPGDELGWHFDGADFVVTLLLQAPEAGGTFEFAPMLRSEDDRNEEGVRALLGGDRSRIRTMSGRARHARALPRPLEPAPRHAGRGLAGAHQRRALLRRRARSPAGRGDVPPVLRAHAGLGVRSEDR